MVIGSFMEPRARPLPLSDLLLITGPMLMLLLALSTSASNLSFALTTAFRLTAGDVEMDSPNREAGTDDTVRASSFGFGMC